MKSVVVAHDDLFVLSGRSTEELDHHGGEPGYRSSQGNPENGTAKRLRLHAVPGPSKDYH
jgi:hypothetical protein